MTAIGAEEKAAVMRVLDSGVLSGFIAGELHGGPEVQALENEWAQYFGFKHAVAMNSATSCLIAACGAVRVRTGGKVIVPPLTMSATATACLPWGATPHFIDIESDYFCLDPEEVFKAIERPLAPFQAIITVDLFGQASNPDLQHLGIPIIQDASQRPIPGGFGDIVVYSLNYHKHIHCGEGGVACTNSDYLAHRLRLIRNHAECGEFTPYDPQQKLYGFNFRITEIEAAIAREQLKKLHADIERRNHLALSQSYLAPVRPGYKHAWYLFPHLQEVDDSFKYSQLLWYTGMLSTRAPAVSIAENVWKRLWMTRP